MNAYFFKNIPLLSFPMFTHHFLGPHPSQIDLAELELKYNEKFVVNFSKYEILSIGQKLNLHIDERGQSHVLLVGDLLLSGSKLLTVLSCNIIDSEICEITCQSDCLEIIKDLPMIFYR
ncbi:hypothetical protein RF11_09552 [Thelohanellus kitauei]|uniref:Uncharacterized protein n=1 Tax=Thelohanellus kitauei TaxID=669202 RepID=A0A0C2N481_THEKT|nr:hypothetical protein RF11_09552 [Thelohanellus kitauei]